MDPFTQRMLERARARQEKIDQKLANSGQAVPKRKPLAENIIKNQVSPAKSPIKISRDSILSPKKSFKEVNKDTPIIKNVIQKSDQTLVTTPQKPRNDIVVTKKEFKSPKHSLNRRNSDVSVEINISHRNDIQIEVQVEERDAPISIVYDSSAARGNDVVIKEIEDETPQVEKKAIEMADEKTEKTALRHNFKSRLDRLGNLYSDKPELSSPIHRTEQEFTSATPPLVKEDPKPRPAAGGKKYGRLAALANQINNWEDDLSHHTYQSQPEVKKTHTTKDEKHDASTLDVSIHSFKDINKVLQTATKPNKSNTNTFKKPMNECQRLEKKIVSELNNFEENTYKGFYFESPDSDTTDLEIVSTQVINSSRKRSASPLVKLDELFDVQKKKKLSSSVSRVQSSGDTAFVSTNADDGQNASHLVKIEVYDLKKISKIPSNEHWKNTETRIKLYTSQTSKDFEQIQTLIFNLSKDICTTINCKKFIFKNN